MTKRNLLKIAIDGPAGAGKSTVAKLVAQRLNYIYIDTGAMYRAITYLAIQRGYNNSQHEQQIAELAESAMISLQNRDERLCILVNEQDVTDIIRSPEVTALVPVISQIPAVRNSMLIQQRRLAVDGGVVMDGRDIGTKVLPDAELKIFLTASVEERTKRRWIELQQKGFNVDFAELKLEISERDKIDSEREVAPLIAAKDSVIMDSSQLSIQEVVDKILNLCKERL